MSEYQKDVMTSFITGAIGGVAKLHSAPTFIAAFAGHLLTINPTISRWLETVVVAFVCGYIGAAAKHCFTYSLKKYNSYKNKKK